MCETNFTLFVYSENRKLAISYQKNNVPASQWPVHLRAIVYFKQDRLNDDNVTKLGLTKVQIQSWQ